MAGKNRTEIYAGEHEVTLKGTHLGYTTEDGVKLTIEEERLTVKSDQAFGPTLKRRLYQSVKVAFTLQQVTLEFLKLLTESDSTISTGGGTSTLVLTAQSAVEDMAMVITGPGPEGKTRTFTATVNIESLGEVPLRKGEEAKLPVTLETVPNSSNEYLTISETTADTTAPSVDSVLPLDDATGVAIDTTVVLTFTETLNTEDAVNPALFAIIKKSDESVVAKGVPAYNPAGPTVTLTPTSDLANSTEYLVIAQAGIRDLAGNAMAAPFTSSFTTVAL